MRKREEDNKILLSCREGKKVHAILPLASVSYNNSLTCRKYFLPPWPQIPIALRILIVEFLSTTSMLKIHLLC